MRSQAELDKSMSFLTNRGLRVNQAVQIFKTITSISIEGMMLLMRYGEPYCILPANLGLAAAVLDRLPPIGKLSLRPLASPCALRPSRNCTYIMTLINDELPEVVAQVIPHLLVIAVITRWVTTLFALSLLYSHETTAISGGNHARSLPVRHIISLTNNFVANKFALR